MGSDNFFAKIASIDPIAHVLHLPGANTAANAEAEAANNTGAVGPYAGDTATLAGANAGYAPGGPGSNSNYVPFTASQPGGIFGSLQRYATDAGNVTPTLTSGPKAPNGVPGGGPNPYAVAPAGNPMNQAAMQAGTQPNAYAAAVTQAAGRANTQPINTNTIWGGARGY